MRPRPVTFLGVLVVALVLLSGCFRPAPSASNDLVSSTKYTKLLIEMDYVEGQKPRTTTVDLLEQRVNERLSKPGGTTVRETSFQSSRTVYSNDDLRELESQQRQNQPTGDTMVLYILVLNGHHSGDTSDAKVLGVQYGRASIALFKETIDTSGGVLGLTFNAADVEKAVLIHELGHALGLVNNGLSMVSNHEDSSHPKHSNNQDSVMYWAVENTLGIPGLSRIPTDFDANDVADIRAAGGK
jgi:hypothetical protein